MQATDHGAATGAGASEHPAATPAAARAPYAHALAILLGSFLLFQVQPIAAKAILPWFGGAPAVWTTCMLAFQSLLLAGYAYAHGSARLLWPRAQALVHVALVLGAIAALPLAFDAGAASQASASPVLGILTLLATSVALPFFVLCGTTPLVQSWAAPGARAPYRLYALSNAGSMLALLSYPVAIEPWLTTRAQGLAWSAAFVVFALACAACARASWRAPQISASHLEAHDAGSAAAPTWRQRALWLGLAACATTLLLAVTNQMCQEVAVIPLLWIVPLSLYLLSFIACFESDRWYSRAWCFPVLVLTLTLLAEATALGARPGVLYAVPVYSAGLFVCCMFCHGELALHRPPPRYMTSFYMMIALGGAVGGAFVSLLAPLFFRGFDELYVGLFACGALATAFAFHSPAYRRPGKGLWHPIVPALMIVTAAIGFAIGARLAARSRPGLREMRNFYGVLRLEDLPAPDGDGLMRYLFHGATRHGQQFLDEDRRRTPTAYYGAASGVGILFDALRSRPPRRVGVIGLGAGVLALYGREGDVLRFYEINPLVIEVASRDFTYLADAGARVTVVPGDARLALESEPSQQFDVFVLDAFSSGAIPMHLLTREAFKLYLSHLAPGGVLALHLTNRHLDLSPVVHGVSRELRLHAKMVESSADALTGELDARWILVSADGELLEREPIQSAGRDLAESFKRPIVWTDEYSNLLQVLD